MKILGVVIVTLFLAGCSGGGSEGPTPSPTPTKAAARPPGRTPTRPTAPLTPRHYPPAPDYIGNSSNLRKHGKGTKAAPGHPGPAHGPAASPEPVATITPGMPAPSDVPKGKKGPRR